MRDIKNKDKQQGQILLITVMLLAAAVTVVMTIAFNSTTDTQISKLEEDSQKALSAAEAALEAAVQQKANVALDSLPAFAGSNITGQADIVEVGGNEFVTPLLQRDEQYTFYMSDYLTLSNYSLADLTIYFKSESPVECPVLELTLINKTNVITKKIIDPCSAVVTTGLPKISALAITESVKGVAFGYKTTGTDLNNVNIPDMKLILVRVLNMPTRIGFTGTGLKSQGRVITSEAKTQSGATKKIELFQSYPQIPSDFFVTGF